MNSSSSDRSDSESAETQRLLLHQRYTWISISQGLLKLKSLCRFSKAVYLILTWTLIVGAIYAGMLYVAAGFVSTSAILLRSSIFVNNNLFISPLLYRLCLHLPLCSILSVDSWLMFGVDDSKQSWLASPAYSFLLSCQLSFLFGSLKDTAVTYLPLMIIILILHDSV